jgi:hypothetical protein
MLYAYTETTLNGKLSPKCVYISANNNTKFKKIYILSIYTIWDGLSLKTISRYCPFRAPLQDLLPTPGDLFTRREKKSPPLAVYIYRTPFPEANLYRSRKEKNWGGGPLRPDNIGSRYTHAYIYKYSFY